MTDQDRFTQFLKILPEEDIRYWDSSIISRHGVESSIYQKLLDFDLFSENLNGHFFDSVIQQQFSQVREASMSLMMYIAERFPVKSRKSFMRLSKAQEGKILLLLQDFENVYRDFIKFTLPKLFGGKSKSLESNNKIGAVYFDVDGRALKIGNKEVGFKGYQLKLMTLLSSRQGTVFDYPEIYSAVYGEHKLENAVMKSLIDKIVHAIHKKLIKNGIKHELIKRIGGYKLIN